MSTMAWYIPLLIFLARIVDVSIGTVRTMLLVSGNRWLTPILGFFEVTVWVLAVSGVLKYLTEWSAILAYGAGFAAGIYVGMLIEDRMAIGYRILRVINPNRGLNLSSLLRSRGFRVTSVEGHGRDGPVEMAFTVVRRREVPDVQEILKEASPDAFVTVERVDRPSGGAWGRTRAGVRPVAGLGGFAK